jgi:hypothetical protein
LYKQYYCGSYKNFSPSVNPQTRVYIARLLISIRDSYLNVSNTDFDQTTLAQVNPLYALVDDAIKALIEPVVENPVQRIRAYLQTIQMNPVQIETELEKYRKISLLYWANSFYSNLLILEGIVYGSAEPFSINYGEYLIFLGQR